MPGTDLLVSVGVKGAGQFAKDLDTMKGSVLSFAAATGGKKLQSLGGVFTALGGGILYAGNAVLVASKDFDVAMRNVQTVSQGARASLQQFEEGIRRVALATNTSAVEAARGMYQIVSSGFDGADAMKVLQASLTAATAGLTDTDTAARAVLSVLNAYGQSASDAKDVSDILFQTVNLGIGTFEELAASVGDVVGIASQVGVPFADIAAAMAAATRSGQTFADASTGVNRIVQDLLQPTQQMTDMLRSLGYESGQAALQGLGFQGVMEAIRSRVGQNAGAYVTLFSRIDAVKTGLALAADSGKAYTDVAGQITDKQARADAATKAFNIQLRAFNNQSKELHNSLMTLGQSGILPLLNMIEQTGSMTAKVVDQFNKLHPALKVGAAMAILTFGAFSLLIGGALLTLPAIAVFAAVAIGRLALAHWVETQAAIKAAVANSFLMRSLVDLGKFQLNVDLAKRIAIFGGRLAGTIGLIFMSITAFDQLYRKSEQLADSIKKLNNAMMDEDVNKAAIAYGKLTKAMRDLPSPGLGDLQGNLELIDKIVQTHLSDITISKEANKAFAELAASSPRSAQRLIEHAEAANIDAEAIYNLKKMLYDAQIAHLQTMQATGEGASAFQTAGGNIIMVADSVKSQLDELRTSADTLADSFGGIFGDAAAQMTQLQDATISTGNAVTAAQYELDKLHSKGPSDAEAEARGHERAIRDAATAQHDLNKLLERRPRRQRGETREDYDIRVADDIANAKDRIAEANARLDDQGLHLIDQAKAEADATNRLTEAKKKQKEADEALVITGDQLLKQLKDQEKAQMDFFKNTSELQRRLGPAGERMLADIIKKGPKEGGMEAKALVGMSDKQLADYLKTFKSIRAITTATAMEDWTKKLPADVQTNLAELWAQVGGEVGKFIELGAGAGETALTTFLQNVRNQVDEQMGLDTHGVGGRGLLPVDWQTKIHLTTDPIGLPTEWTILLHTLPDTTPIPGVNVPIPGAYKDITQGGPPGPVPAPEAPLPPPAPPPSTRPGPQEEIVGMGHTGLSPIGIAGKVLDAMQSASENFRHMIHGWTSGWAGGGIETHQAMIGNGTTRMWNEPETGGEAYIPLGLSKRGRSEHILDQVAGMFGGSFQRFADGGITDFVDSMIQTGTTQVGGTTFRVSDLDSSRLSRQDLTSLYSAFLRLQYSDPIKTALITIGSKGFGSGDLAYSGGGSDVMENWRLGQEPSGREINLNWPAIQRYKNKRWFRDNSYLVAHHGKSTIADVLQHEWGHGFDEITGALSGSNSQFNLEHIAQAFGITRPIGTGSDSEQYFFKKYLGPKVASVIGSAYAKTDPAEMLAEIYSAARRGNAPSMAAIAAIRQDYLLNTSHIRGGQAAASRGNNTFLPPGIAMAGDPRLFNPTGSALRAFAAGGVMSPADVGGGQSVPQSPMMAAIKQIASTGSNLLLGIGGHLQDTIGTPAEMAYDSTVMNKLQTLARGLRNVPNPQEIVAKKMFDFMDARLTKAWVAKGYEVFDGNIHLPGTTFPPHYSEIDKYIAEKLALVEQASQLGNIAMWMYQFGQTPSAAPGDSVRIGSGKFSLPSNTSFHDWRVAGEKAGYYQLYGAGNRSLDIGTIGLTPQWVYDHLPKEHSLWGLRHSKRKYADGGIFTEPVGMAQLHGPEAIIPLGNPSKTLAAMQRTGLASMMTSSSGGAVDQSTHVSHSYTVEKIETPDPAAFERWAAGRQRMNALAGV